MKIKKVSTSFFAGITDKEIDLNDGINVIYGDNESGKSTLVNLISATLFQDAKLDKRKDKYFNENAFPAERADGKTRGRNIDGSVELEAPDGSYKLAKEWGEEAVSKLTAPGGIIKNQEDIKETLKSVLGCDEGTYREMLLSPQSDALANLEKLLKGSAKDGAETNKFLSETVSRAFAQSDGVPVDKLEQEIEKEINKLTEKGWDIEKNAPVKNYKEKKNNLGEIVKSLKEYDNARGNVARLNDLGLDYDAALSDFSEAELSLNEAENRLSDFEKYAAVIRDVSENKKAEKRIQEELVKYKRALEEFPKAQEALKKARELLSEKENRALLDRFKKSKKHNDELLKIDGELQALTRPSESEIKEQERSERKLLKLRNKLRGMNTAATIKMLGGNSVKITSLLSGEPIELDGENAVLTEAVRIEIPGVMEMSLAPAEVDISEVNAEIAELEKRAAEILGKYGCNSTEELKQLAEKFDKLSNDKKFAENNLGLSLGGDDFSELEVKVKALSDVREAASVEGDISALCGGSDINTFIGKKENAVETFKAAYSDEDKLRALIGEREGDLEKAQKALTAAENIPEKYRGVSDADAHCKQLKASVKAAADSKEEALKRRTEAETKLGDFVENNGDDLLEQLEKTEAEYNARIELLHRWLHIREVFNAHKETLANNPLEDLEKNFTAYLGEISEDRITAEFTEAGKPDFEVASGDYRLDYAKLSDGTKETVYLAYRLAVLEHLFPDGGGVIVLDDPLNDMDANRVERACGLIKRVAERHQVIFLTCREEYAERLGGNVVSI